MNGLTLNLQKGPPVVNYRYTPEEIGELNAENDRLSAIEAAARALFIGSIDTGYMTEVSTEKFDALGKLLTQQ